ncbi:MAG: glycosyltransferase family 4 protein, partial [Armatimonadetes bacterium]|nr:glycosyltransferase family 4 protein [Armatimonadota bacterium]
TDGVAVPEDRAPGFRVLFAGRLTPMKNLQTCLRAVALVSQATFHVIGEGDQRPGLEALAASLGISSRVEFLGSVSEARLEEEYARAHAALYIPFDEPMGLIPMEAALREVPSVVSSHAGPAEVVLDGQTGIHVDAKDPASVADGLTRLAADPALRARLGAGARERVRQDMSFDLYAHTLETVLNSALWRVGEEQPS